MRQKIVATSVAGGLIVGAAFVVAAVAGPAVAIAQEDSAQTTEADSDGPHLRHSAVLEEVLDDLVDAGTISQEQADTIADALAAKAEAIKAERQELRELISGFLDDDVIDADELAQLPDDHPFNEADGRFSEALEDGELTRQEIREARPHPRKNLFKRGARFGALLDDGGIDQEEFDSLADDHPLKTADVSEYLEDGVITLDELRELRQSQHDSGDAA